MNPETYQTRVSEWLRVCFTPEICADKIERNHRFLEEALELVQAAGCTQSEAHQLVYYVFGRPVGELGQEVGGVKVTLAALCNAHMVDLDAEAERELARVWTKIDKIRAKQASKPKHSPLPEHVGDALGVERDAAVKAIRALRIPLPGTPFERGRAAGLEAAEKAVAGLCEKPCAHCLGAGWVHPILYGVPTGPMRVCEVCKNPEDKPCL